MELQFVWLEDLPPFKKHTIIKCSNRFSVNVDTVDGKQKKVSILLKKESQFIDNFFHKDVACISALIGQNGVGKSSFLKALIGILNNTPNELPIHGYIALFYDPEKRRFVKSENSWQVSLCLDEDIIPFDLSASRHDFKTLYHSPIFNFSTLLVRPGARNHIDVSADCFLRDVKKENDILDIASVFRYMNIKRQMKFINKVEKTKIPFDLPNQLIIKPSFFREKRSIDLTNQTDNPHPAREFDDKIEKVRDFFLDQGNKRYLEIENSAEPPVKSNLKLLFLLNLIGHFFDAVGQERDFNKGSDNSIYELESIQKYPDDLEISFRNFLTKQKWTPDNGVSAIKYMDSFEALIQSEKSSIAVNDPKALITEDFDLAIELLEKEINYRQSLTTDLNHNYIREVLKVDWRELSSGQNAFLNLFSWIFSSTEDIKRTNPRWIYLLLDESDLGFHPEWQRQYVNRLLEVLPEIFKHIKLQIILTSHSPFVISDLPASNVVYLKQSEEKQTVVDELSTQTFSANIHTLLATRFFMGSGLTGQFALNKIKKLASKIESDNFEKNKETIWHEIQMIGEPLIRQEFEKIYFRKAPESLQDKYMLQREKIEKLEKQINNSKL